MKNQSAMQDRGAAFERRLGPLLPLPPQWGVEAAAGGLPVALAVVAYAATQAPTVTWRNGGADGAELAAAAYVWGVAHPPGYPLYLAVVRLAQYLPMGDPAYRATLVSTVGAMGAAALAYVAVRLLLGLGGGISSASARIGASYAGAALAFGPVLWSQAVVAEVYTFGAALFGFIVVALALWLRRPTAWRTAGLGASLALLLSHQPTFAALVPVIGALVWRRGGADTDAGRSSGRWNGRTGARNGKKVRLLCTFAAALLLCPAVLLTEWVRAGFAPALNWGDPSTLGRWWIQVTAAIYRPYFSAYAAGTEVLRVPVVAALLARQAGWPGLALALLGFAWLWAQARPAAVVLGVCAGWFAAFAILYNAKDGEVYLLPAIQALALAAGAGAAWVREELPASQRHAVPIALAGLVAWQVASAWATVDASHDRAARAWGEATLAAAPARAVLQTTRDEHTFVLWYLQTAEGVRPDVAVVDYRLTQFEWYRRQMEARFPGLSASGALGPARRDVP